MGNPAGACLSRVWLEVVGMTHGICDECGSFNLSFGHMVDGDLRRGYSCEKCGYKVVE